ncbi:protein kinase [bacterium]|nr:protein kinase [bacterium]
MSRKVLNERYQLELKLGEGGMGSVYRAIDLATNRDVAVKILRRDLAESKHARRRFAREARAAGMLNHPGIVRTMDFVDDVRPYLVMELINGVSLRRYIRRERPDAFRLLDICDELCESLAHAHDRGVVHRDLKPDNIVVTPEGRVKILDFGLARVRIPEISHLTRSGSALGTCSYMAPEQAAGKPADERSDLYAIGVILYEALTGSIPFTADEPASILYMHVHEAPKPPRSLNPDIPVEMERLVLQLMEKKPAQRPANARVLKGLVAGVRRSLKGEETAIMEAVSMVASLSQLPAATAVPMALQMPSMSSNSNTEPSDGDAVSVLAADIPNFTMFTRDRNPLETTELESVLIDELEHCVRDHAGKMLDRYGTRIVAAFCGADHGSRAVQSAQTMRSRVQAVLSRYSLITSPTVSAGVFGGELPKRGAGDSWEEMAKQELMHGAARLERLSRKLPDDTLVSETSLGNSTHLTTEPLRSLFVRGRREPIQVYRVLNAG